MALLAGGVTGLTSRYWLTFRNDDRNFDIKLPHSPDFAHPSLDMFVALSELVTLRTQLDPLMVQHMYPLFMDEPWGPHHISSSYKQILDIIGTPPYSKPACSDAVRGRLGKGQVWFVSHLLTTWYLGIYYHEQRPSRRVAYESALMFDAIRGTLPVPLIESTGFGRWAEPPSGT